MRQDAPAVHGISCISQVYCGRSHSKLCFTSELEPEQGLCLLGNFWAHIIQLKFFDPKRQSWHARPVPARAGSFYSQGHQYSYFGLCTPIPSCCCSSQASAPVSSDDVRAVIAAIQVDKAGNAPQLHLGGSTEISAHLKFPYESLWL